MSAMSDDAAARGMSPAVRMWGAIVVSGAIVVGYVAAVIVVLCQPLPAGSEMVANNLLTTLATLTTGVAGYWIGSSSGSASKDTKK